MPIYEFECSACEKSFDHLAKSMNDHDVAVACPECGSKKTARRMSVFAVASGSGPAHQTASSPPSGMCGCGRVPGSCGNN
jgi:putative FmdB family regulatory protein